jgi:hypothetical protein
MSIDLPALSLPDIQTIAIVDNIHSSERDLPYWEAEIAGFKTISVPTDLESLEEVVAFIQAHAQAAICTHRLASQGHSGFYGAELVAALYDLKIPALLVTQYTDIDIHTTIRRWRDKIPVVLHLRDLSFETITEHLQTCRDELRGIIPESRKPYRVMLNIVDVQEVAGEKVIDVTVGRWDHYQVVRFPISLVPPELHTHMQPEVWLFADVNIKAEYHDQLYFRSIALAPTPAYDEDMVYCVDLEQATQEGWDSKRWEEEYTRLSDFSWLEAEPNQYTE